ncbi:hypothetical protein LTR39_001861, partial [Cryomyces antarcticus]
TDKDEKIRGAPRTDEDENGSSDEFEDGGPTEKEAEAQGNALKAVGIPYGSPEQPASSGRGAADGNFDEVAL